MNIKGLNPNLSALDPRVRTENKTGVRTQNSSDRDPNGRRDENEQELKRNLNDEEFENAIKILHEIPAIKAQSLNIRIEINESVRTIYIEDANGKTVRRLSESDLWLVTREKDRPTGKILDKAG